MPKYFQVSDDFDLDALGDNAAALKPFEPEDVDGLKSNANKILSEKKALEAKYADLEAQFKKMKVDSPAKDDKGSEKLQLQLEDAMARLKERDDAYNKLMEDNKKSQIKAEADKIAAGLTKDIRRAALLSEKIGRRIDIDNGSVVVLDPNGNPTVSGLKDLTSAIRQEYDFLVDGSQASGGGAPGGRGGAAETKTLTRSDFENMDLSQRSTFFKEGGKLTDD